MIAAISVMVRMPSGGTRRGENASDVIETMLQRRSIAPRFAVSKIPDGT